MKPMPFTSSSGGADQNRSRSALRGRFSFPAYNSVMTGKSLILTIGHVDPPDAGLDNFSDEADTFNPSTAGQSRSAARRAGHPPAQRCGGSGHRVHRLDIGCGAFGGDPVWLHWVTPVYRCCPNPHLALLFSAAPENAHMRPSLMWSPGSTYSIEL